MLTSYITTRNFKPLSSAYIHDDQVDLLNKGVFSSGNLGAMYTPILSANNDFVNNNFSFLNLTQESRLDDFTNIRIPENKERIYTGTLATTDTNGIIRYFAFAEGRWYNPNTDLIIYNQSFGAALSSRNDLCFFNFDLTDPTYCTVSHLYQNSEFYLFFDPTKAPGDLYNIGFAALSGFNEGNDYTRKFYYSYDEQNDLLTLQVKTPATSYQLVRSFGRMDLQSIDDLNPNIEMDENSIFILSAFRIKEFPRLAVDWGSYTRSFDQNNINIDTGRSFYDLRNNFLVNREFYNLKEEEVQLPVNILTLKNQLNLNNDQGRGNVFPDEPEVDYRDYKSLFAGGNQERGFLNLQLGYESYSTPYLFPQGKTTWFHMPQSMYPYKRLNVKSTQLVKAGAIPGDHPLRSDKIFKKIANYSQTSNQGNSTGEKTGLWLCTWLSGGPSIDSEPVWVDRFYTPAITTAYQALSAKPASITVTSSYDCLDLPQGVYDAPSSLTFEPGCWYAYSHIGESDALQNIKNLEKNLQQYGFDVYKLTDGSVLEPQVVDGVDTYVFTGKEIAQFEVPNLVLPTNTFTFSFWANSDDWRVPKGYEIAGNYTDYGLGVFNYNLVTPFIYYLSNGKILVLNRDLELLTTFDSGLSAFGNIVNIFRRDPLNTFHALTDKQIVIEYNVRETLVDATTALSGTNGMPIFTTNDELRGLLLYKDGTIKSINLFSNLYTPTSATFTIGNPLSAKEVRRLLDGSVVTIEGTQSQVYGTGVYFLSSDNTIHSYSTTTKTLCTFIGDAKRKYTTFCIDKDSNTWAASGNTVTIFDRYGTATTSFALTADSKLSTTPLKIRNITFLENFDSGNLITDTLISASGSKEGYTLVYRLNESREIEKTISLQTGTDLLINPDPSNHGFNYSYLKTRYNVPGYTFKARLYNPLNDEDIEIPQVTVVADDISSGYHHFSVVLDSPGGTLTVYLDGTPYNVSTFTPQKFNYLNLISTRITAGASPFAGSLLLYDYLDQSKTVKTSYLCKGFDVQYMYLHNKALDYFDINMLYKQKLLPKDLVWDVPSGKRSFIDSVSRFFKQKIPGGKSGLFNLWINSNYLTEDTKQLLNIAIQQKIKEITPAYSKLFQIKWISNNPSVSADYQFPYFPGNTLTTGSLNT